MTTATKFHPMTKATAEASINCLNDAVSGFAALQNDLRNIAALGHSLSPKGLNALADRIGGYRELIRDGAGPFTAQLQGFEV